LQGLKAELPITIINQKGKRGFVFLGSERQKKMINCEDAILQHVVSLLFPVKF